MKKLINISLMLLIIIINSCAPESENSSEVNNKHLDTYYSARREVYLKLDENEEFRIYDEKGQAIGGEYEIEKEDITLEFKTGKRGIIMGKIIGDTIFLGGIGNNYREYEMRFDIVK